MQISTKTGLVTLQIARRPTRMVSTTGLTWNIMLDFVLRLYEWELEQRFCAYFFEIQILKKK